MTGSPWSWKTGVGTRSRETQRLRQQTAVRDPTGRVRGSSSNSVTTAKSTSTPERKIGAARRKSFSLRSAESTATTPSTSRSLETTPSPTGWIFESDHWGYVRVGSAVEGYREDPNDDDEFRTHLTAGRIYRFEVRGAADPNDPNDKWTSEIPSVALWNLPPTTPLGSHNPFGENAVLEYDITETDTYQIITNTNYNGGTAGTYQLKVTDITDEINNAINNQPQTSSEPPGGDVTSADPGYVRVGDSVTGRKGTATDIADSDPFRTYLRYGRTYRFEVKGSGDPSNQWTFGNPGVYLFEIDEARPLLGNNPGQGENAVLEYTITKTGPYEIVANLRETGAPGTYQLEVTDITE